MCRIINGESHLGDQSKSDTDTKQVEMSATRFLLLAAVCFCLSALTIRADVPPGVIQPQCDSYPLPGCPKNLDPVCGTDGQTYNNECLVCLENLHREDPIFIVKRNAC